MQKKLISILSLVLLLMLLLSLFLVSCGDGIKEAVQAGSAAEAEDSNPQKLMILDTGMSLTQEQVLSQIKAENLKANNGYLDDDPIVAIVTLPGESLLDLFLADAASGAQSVAEFAQSEAGQEAAAGIATEQEALIRELETRGLIDGVEYAYSTVMNAVAVSTTYGNFEEIGQLANVSKTILSETYNLPQAVNGTDASAIINAVDIYETGIFDSSCVTYTGKGTAVAILDSGFDCDHTVFSNMPDTTNLLITMRDVDRILSASNALKLDHSAKLTDLYINTKIPFAFDYADKDTDVYPYDSEHGTHVAGIIGGKDETITGIAVDTQLVLMKVFPDLDDGGKTEDILAALEDAVLLGVDAINMSLGSSCGFAREADGDAINTVYDKIGQSGISLITAASNSYSSAYGGAQGNTNKVTNPDSGTVGSPSTYGAALSVASISGTNSKYLIGNDEQVIFFNESNNNAGEPNDFFAELGLAAGETRTYEYVTVPGVGMKANYTSIDVTGKIALVRRGDTTFEDKALQAKNAGAVACIIYNNIEGDILMSMGKTDHIPTISISKENGTRLASRPSGTITISYVQQAGPFMSDFSSWGPSPNLELKPEITAHGGNILSAVPGGGYDELSGTSMATPNLCGIVVLIRQYLKEKYPEYSYQQISVMCNQMLMSTATIILNEEGNPYSPRKQGAGLASLANVVNTGAYLTVDGIDRAKLELDDDAERNGVYEMTFRIENISERDISYLLSVIAMTETVSSSDNTFVAEKDQLLGGNFTVSVTGEGSLAGDAVTVKAGSSVNVTVTYRLSDADKAMIDSLFPYGMYVEGFVTLDAAGEDEIDLNIPFLAFYGDWTEAPMFDKTYYEVESEAHDASIDDEDKLKADYFATTPYGSYYYNYIIPLGTYLYDIDTSVYDAIPASLEHIAISDTLGTIDGISAVYAGLLRNAKRMTYTITDLVTGEVVKEYVVDNATKAYSYGGSPVPNYEYLKWKSAELGLVNNRRYEFKMEGLLDYGDGGATTNVRNTFSFDFCLDNEAPVLKDVTYEKVYDKSLKKDRYYLTMTIYDNQYVQSVTPIAFSSSSSYAFLTEHPIPVYSQPGTDNVLRIEITDYLEELYADEVITSALAFSIDDYALNSNIYLCQLPGTRGDFKFTKDGTMEGTDLTILSLYENEVVDLTRYLATADATADESKDYLKHLIWTSSNEKVAVVQEGQVRGIAEGRATITVQEGMDLKQAVLIVNVKAAEPPEEASASAVSSESKGPTLRLMSTNDVPSASDATIDSIRFSYFETVFAYSRAAQTSKIGQTGDRTYISSLGGDGVSFYPGEKIQLYYDLDPWYVADKYAVTFSSTNENVAIVDQNGVVTALKKGSTTIVLRVEGSNLMARLRVTVNSEFIIEDRTLVAYKGLGGEVVIPDDEGILYIGAYAFCLYDTDHSIELTDEDYDANKIPSANTTVTSVVIPDGVQEIQKYAFYNCSGLRSVTLPDSVKFIREYSFYGAEKLTTVNLENVQVIGAYAFSGCGDLADITLPVTYAIGVRAFQNCTSLTSLDLSKLRNTGKEAFKGCSSLKQVTLAEKTKLSEGMFVQCGLETVDLYAALEIPAYCFAQCPALTTVTFHNDLVKIGTGAFCQNDSLVNVVFPARVDTIGEQAFYDCNSLEAITLPDCEVNLENYCFFDCDLLSTLSFKENTVLKAIKGAAFQATALTVFTVPAANTAYQVSPDGHLLLNGTGDTILLAAIGHDYGDLVIDEAYTTIGSGAFAGAAVTSLTITNPSTVIGDYAFAGCEGLKTVTFPATSGLTVGKHAFHYTSALTTLNHLDAVMTVGDYAFSGSGITSVTVGSHATYGEGVFFRSKLETVTIGEGTVFGLGCFQHCTSLTTVNMPAGGGVHFGSACFANDTKLSVIDLSKIDRFLEDETFYGCSSLTSANLANVEVIGKYAFSDCSSLYTVKVPQVVEIGEGAFSRYAKDGGAPIFSFISLPATLVSIGDGAFLGCEGLSEITIPATVTSFGDFAFSYCTHLTRVTLPQNVTRIGQYAFAGCENLSDINLGHVTEIADYAFTSCAALTTVDLSAVETVGFGAFASSAVSGAVNAPRLTSVGDYAFQRTSITAFTAPKLVSVGDAAFQGNAFLTEFIFPEELTHVGTMAFQGCTSLKSFYVSVGGEKTANGETSDGYALVIDGVLYTRLPSGHLQLSSVPAALETDTLVVAEDTYRVELYAGNDNPHILKIVFPASLKLIGNYAFYGYTGLKTVEFRSFTAPAWENSYDEHASLSEDDPGYGLLHNQFDLFNLELCYYNFVDLLGKYTPLTMILPSNPDAEGYDALPYLVGFGEVSNAERSDYVAMDKTLSGFISYAGQISGITTVTLSHETLINNAVAALNAMKQNAVDFGYTQEAWDEMVATVTQAKASLTALKLANASRAAQTLQAKINALPDTYTHDVHAAMQEIEALLSELAVSERSLLTLTRYNALLDSYLADVDAPAEPPAEPLPPAPESHFPAWAVVLIAVASVAIVGGITVAIVIVCKKGKKIV